jgi:hypothetical protein
VADRYDPLGSGIKEATTGKRNCSNITTRRAHRKIGGAVNGRRDDFAVDDRGAGTDVPCVGGDFLKAVGPIVPASREDLYLGVGEMDLNAVSVELDLMNPALTARRFRDRCGESRLDEARKWCLCADRRRLFALERHGSHQAHRKRKLDIVVSAFVPLDEFFEVERHVAKLQIATPAQLMGHVGMLFSLQSALISSQWARM